jgi:hypothetical protein
MLLDLLTTRHWLFPSISLYTGSHKEQPSLGRPVPSHFIRVRPAIRLPAQANQGPFLASGTGKPGCCCMPRLKNKFFPSLMQKVWSAAAVLQHLLPLTARLPKPSPSVHVTQYFSASWLHTNNFTSKWAKRGDTRLGTLQRPVKGQPMKPRPSSTKRMNPFPSRPPNSRDGGAALR